MSGRLTDIDELLLKARPGPARDYIMESSRAYEAGAYRSAIITSWIAVVFDIIGKFHDLSLSGDAEAKAIVTQYERIQASNNVDGALRFERDILETAKNKFELLNDQEYADLKRLREDRNRCAHPSMAGDDAYRPPAELARFHLYSAVTNLLQHQPVQGKAALGRLIQQVESPYFPTDCQLAQVLFSSSPLAKPRDSLVRNFVVIVLKELVSGSNDSRWLRYLAALGAVVSMHRSLVLATCGEKLSTLARQVGDHLGPLTRLLHEHSELISCLDNDVELTLRAYVSDMPSSDLDSTLDDALDMPFLQSEARDRVKKLTLIDWTKLMLRPGIPCDELIHHGIALLESSENYDHANRVAPWLLRHHFGLSEAHVRAIFYAAAHNSQVSGSHQSKRLLSAIRDCGRFEIAYLREISEETGLDSRWDGLKEG